MGQDRDNGCLQGSYPILYQGVLSFRKAFFMDPIRLQGFLYKETGWGAVLRSPILSCQSLGCPIFL